MSIYDLLIYQREEIVQGEVWRLLTGQLLHLSIEHYIYNIVAFLLLYNIALKLHSERIFWLSVIWCNIATGLAIFFMLPNVIWYAGASGFLHGVVLVMIIQLIKQQLFLGLFFLLIIITKLVYEQVFGVIGQFNFKVIVDVHLIGFISGVLYLVAKGKKIKT